MTTNIAKEHQRHFAYYNTQYDGKGGIAHEDHGGLWCSCGEYDSGPQEGSRPWIEWHEHVARSIAVIVWHEAFNIGLNEQARVDNGYEPTTNPFEDTDL